MWDELGGPQKPGGCYFYSFCSIARAYMMSFWIEVRSSAHSQVLCLTAVLKRKKEGAGVMWQVWKWAAESLLQQAHNANLSSECAQRSVFVHERKSRDPEITDGLFGLRCCTQTGEGVTIFFYHGNLIKQKSVPPPTETQCLSCCLRSPANCNTTSLLLALLGHACH